MCGSHWYVYLPLLRVTVTVLEPLKLRPGPLSRKLWTADLSVTVIVYLPGFSVLTFTPAFLSVIVKPGPVVPTSFVGLMPTPAEGATSATAATRPVLRSA